MTGKTDNLMHDQECVDSKRSSVNVCDQRKGFIQPRPA